MMADCSVRQRLFGEGMVSWVISQLPAGSFRRVLIKPNWVSHESDAEFPIQALVTSATLIDAVIQACLRKYTEAEDIAVADVPVQSCNWQMLREQAGIVTLEQRYRTSCVPTVRFLDLRREAFESVDGYFEEIETQGDPAGYREVILGKDSYLEEVAIADLRVSDYGPEIMRASHSPGQHRYVIAGTVLDADLVINLPKMKTHQKAGMTGALKNLVGVNGEKGCLAHFRMASATDPGDQFMAGTPAATVIQTRIRAMVQKRSRLTFKVLRKGWRIARQVIGIEIRGTRENLRRRFYIADGSWFGNDTIWRMVYDLNRVVRYARAEGGTLADVPQREYVAIMDGIVAGEGNGPLQPLPVQTNVLLAASDPFVLDMCATALMGLNRHSMPTLAHHRSFGQAGGWGAFDPADLNIDLDGQACRGVDSLPVLHRFEPAPGWRGHVERGAA